MFLFRTQSGQVDLPEDGYHLEMILINRYGWLDDEKYQRFMLENGIEIEVFTRSQGFGLQDSHTAV